MAELRDLIRTYELLKEYGKASERTIVELTPWVIGLDAILIGAALSYLPHLQAQTLKFKVFPAIGLLLLTASFIAGIYCKKVEIEYVVKKTEDARLQHLIEQAKVMNNPSGLAEWSKEWAIVSKELEGLQEGFSASQRTCFDSFFAGVGLLALGVLVVLFRPELHQVREFLSAPSCQCSQQAMPR